MKFKEYVEGVKKMLEDNPNWGELEMAQVERWDGDEVCLPWYDDKDGKICL